MPTVHARALKRAAQICGEYELAVELGVSDRELRYWMQGLAYRRTGSSRRLSISSTNTRSKR